jgi:hypothetical protein
MTFHVDFWIAAAAAAPVIALSATVAVSDNMKLGLRLRTLARRSPTTWELARKYERRALIVSGINVLAQCGILFASLEALTIDRDPISPTIIIYGGLLGLLAIFYTILLNGRAQRVAAQLGIDREEQAATLQQDADYEDE